MLWLFGGDLAAIPPGLAGVGADPGVGGAQPGAGAAAGVSHQHLLRAVLGGAQAVGQRGQSHPQPGPADVGGDRHTRP